MVYDKFSDLSYHPFWSGDTMKIMEFRLDGKDTTHKRIETVNYIIGIPGIIPTLTLWLRTDISPKCLDVLHAKRRMGSPARF